MTKLLSMANVITASDCSRDGLRNSRNGLVALTISFSEAEKMKLYTIYSPPEHRDQVLHKTKAEAMADNEHFDGKTTE